MNKLKIRNSSLLNWKLEKLVKEHDLTVRKLSERSGVAVGTVQRLLDDPQCNPTLSSLKALAKVLNSSISYLIGEEEAKPRKCFKIPVLDYENLLVELEQLPEIKKNKIEENKFIVISLEEDLGINVNSYFVIQLKISSPIRSIYPPGAYLIFKKEINFYSSSHVLAYHAESNAILFKELLIDAPHYYLRSPNPAIQQDELIAIKANDRILATLVQVNLHGS